MEGWGAEVSVEPRGSLEQLGRGKHSQDKAGKPGSAGPDT